MFDSVNFTMQRPSARWPYVALILLILFFGLMRWRLRGLPLERDEGEYAYAGQLMLKGVPPYTLLYTMKLPGTFFAYAAIFLVFGQSSAGVHLGLLVVNAATIWLMFLLGRRLFGDLGGVVAAATYGLLTASTSVVGFAGHATNFVVLPAVAATFLLFSALERQRHWLFFCSGLLFGVGFLMKQPGLLLAVFGAVYLVASRCLYENRSWPSILRQIGWYAAGVVLPFAATCLLMVKYGVFGRFWFWTFQYAREYGSIATMGEGLRSFAQTFSTLLHAAGWIWLLAAIGFSSLLWSQATRKYRFFLASFLAFSFLAVCPGLYFRHHYFILMLPAASLLVAGAVIALRHWLHRSTRTSAWAVAPILFFALAFSVSLYGQRGVLFEMPLDQVYWATYRNSPFPEAATVASYIRQHASPDARIAVLGSEPEIYFYSDRLSATGYIYTYGLMEQQQFAREMQQEMISEIEAARPEYVVLVNVPASFGRLPSSDGLIFRWMDSFLESQYESVGVADMLGPTQYRWDGEAAWYRPRAKLFLKVYRRK